MVEDARVNGQGRAVGARSLRNQVTRLGIVAVRQIAAVRQIVVDRSKSPQYSKSLQHGEL
jgi:phage tail sheath protein FI